MNFKEILELIDKVAERDIAGVEIEQAGTKIKIEGKHAPAQQMIASYVTGDPQAPGAPGAPMPVLAPPVTQTAEQKQADLKQAEEDIEKGLHIITSPIVGTFYRAANPESEVFVNVGDRITRGKVLCLVEAMKLMNEIESDIDGVITKIYPQNGQPIEYGEKLFAVKV